MKLQVFARLQKIQTAGTSGYRLFDQDDGFAFGYHLAKAAGASRNGVYEVDTFLICLALLNREKMKKILNKKIIQAAVQKGLKDPSDVLQWVKKSMKHQKSKPELTEGNEDKFDKWDLENDNIHYMIQTMADCNEYNPWPINLTEPILLSYLSGYRVPPRLINAFKAWVAYEEANGTKKKFLDYFKAFIKGIERGKLDYRVLISPSMMRSYLFGLEGGSSANIERELVLMGLSTKEEVKSLPFNKILKRIVAEWQGK
jgi:hypothetical protein